MGSISSMKGAMTSYQCRGSSRFVLWKGYGIEVRLLSPFSPCDGRRCLEVAVTAAPPSSYENNFTDHLLCCCWVYQLSI